MTTPDEQITPLDEPAPIQPTNGAGTMPDDPDQSGVSQDPAPDLDEAEHAALLATPGGLTAHQILTWEASQIGTGEHPPGSNHTIYSAWGDGPWCFYFQSFGFRKYNALALIFGAHGYVPDFKGIFSPHGEFHTSSPRAGDLVAFDFNRSGEPEHIGMVEKVISGSVIQTIEGNTSDKVMRRTRSRSYVYGYATPKYGSTPTPTPTEDTLRTVVDLGAEKAQTIKAGARYSLGYELEYGGGDTGKIHADADKSGRYPSIYPAGADAPYGVTAEVALAGTPHPGVKLAVAQYERKTNKRERDIRTQGLAVANDVLHANVRMSDQHKYRIDVINDSDVDVVVQRAYLLITH